MKASSVALLEKHLNEGSLLSVYIVACPHAADRREITSKIVAAIKKVKNPEVQRFSGNASFASAFQELQTVSLFSSERVLLLDDSEEWKPEENAFLVRWIQNPPGKITLILGVTNASALAHFLKSPAFFIDLLQEKPWQRQQRLLEDLRSLSRESRIVVDESVFDFLFHQVGSDWLLLKSELEKLLSYAAEKKHITLEEARRLASSGIFPEGWALAEQLIYHSQGLMTAPSLDTNALLALLGQLRYYLRLGRQLASGEEKGIKPYQVQKFKDKSRAKGPLFFERGILALNEIEALVKSSSLSAQLLLHRFAVRLHLEHTLS